MTETPRLKLLLRKLESRVKIQLPVVFNKIVQNDLSIAMCFN